MYASTWICTKTRELEWTDPDRGISALSLDESGKGVSGVLES
jgi:hypothetical protein